MERVLHGLHWKSLLLYLDDIIVIAPDFNTHLQQLEEVLQRLQQAGLKLKPSKCELLQSEVRYLGHIVSANGVATDPEKVAAVKDWPTPTGIKQLQAFLGTVGYYRQYLPDFATIAQPLHRLTSKETEWTWGEAEQCSFEQLKGRLVTAPVLGYPDPSKQYILDTDASGYGVGAVLSQEQEGKERVIAFYSKTLSPPEKNYCVTRRELLATVKAIKHFRPYLYGQKFRLRTDHASLRWLCRRKEPSNQVARWLEILAEFSYTLEHRAGQKHGNADGLSRQACEDCRQCESIERRDGGPTRQELDSEDQVSALKVAGLEDPRPLSGKSVTDGMLPSALKAAEEEDPPTDTWTDTLLTTAKIVTRTTQADAELAKEQAAGMGPVAVIYQALLNDKEVTEEQLELGSAELRRLHQQRDSLRLRTDGVLEARVAPQGKPRWCAVCPPSLRGSVIWRTHVLVHSGVARTTSRLQLTWYWPGMTSLIRRIIRSCEVCQTAKHGGAKAAQGKQRLYAGRPWQKVAVDLVGPMPETTKGNRWILVLVDHFTRWQDALAIPDATAPVVAAILDERVFCYLGLPEQIHTDQGAQFESQLMTELCQLWGVAKTRTTPYHPQANGMVERNNKGLGDSLRALLLGRGQEEWDSLLPQIMRAHRGTPHTATGETANMLMMGRELRLPDQLQHQPPPEEFSPQHEFVVQMRERLEQAHEALRQQQLEIRQDDQEEPPLFAPGDMVWLQNKRRKRGDNSKLQQKFVGPYQVLEAYSNHTYKIERQGQASIQNESRLKFYYPCTEESGKAPTSLEPRRRPNMKGIIKPKKTVETPDNLEIFMPPEMNLLPELGEAIPPVPEPQITEPRPTDPQQGEPDTEVEQLPTPTVPTSPTPPPVEGSGRPSRVTKMPDKYRDYECYPVQTGGYPHPPMVHGETDHSPVAGSMNKEGKILWSQVVKQPRRPATKCMPEDSKLRKEPNPMPGEMMSVNLSTVEPAPYRPEETLYKSQLLDTRRQKDYAPGSPRLGYPQKGNERLVELSRQEWPELSSQRRNTIGPAVCRPAELALGPSIPIERKSRSCSTRCKKQLSSMTNGSEVIRDPKPGLICNAEEYTQEVCKKAKQTCWPCAVSEEIASRQVEATSTETQNNRHCQQLEMNSTVTNEELLEEGELDSSLIKLLEELPGCTESSMIKNDLSDWSDGGLLSESEDNIEAALKVAAQYTSTLPEKTRSNAQNSYEQKSKGDKPQLAESTLKVVDQQPKLSVLKVTEAMKIISLNQPVQSTIPISKIVPHKEIHRVKPKDTTAGSIPAGTLPGVPAQNREDKSQPPDQVMLVVTENHDWFTDLVMSESESSEPEVTETSQPSHKQQRPASNSPVQPVLKATGAQGEIISKVQRNKHITPEIKSKIGRVLSSDDNQLALKVASGVKRKGNKSPVIQNEQQPLFTQEPCYINRINVMTSVAGASSPEEVDSAGKRVAVISPVRPPLKKKLRVELTRVDTPQDQPHSEESSQPSRLVKRVPTQEWMTREMKEKVEAAVKGERQCRLCDYKTSKRRIRIHIRQHYCMHFCQCGYKNISRDQVAEHQKYTRQPGHTREVCRVFMVEKDQFPSFRKYMKWPEDMSFGTLLPVTPSAMTKIDVVEDKPENQGPVETAPRVNSQSSNKKVAPKVNHPLRLPEGYRIPRVQNQKDTDLQDNTEPQVDIPHQPEPETIAESPEVPRRNICQEGTRRWYTEAEPKLLVVEAGARTNLERILRTQPPSRAIPGMRTRVGEQLETEAESLERKAQDIDRTRRQGRLNPEDSRELRKEADTLRSEASRLRSLAAQIQLDSN